MVSKRARVGSLIPVVVVLVGGCATQRVDFSRIQRPPRATALDAYEVFVGSWTWQARMLGTEGPDRLWNGTAQWEWTLDKRSLLGKISAKSERAEFVATGIWSWHPKTGKYIWWMFNNWGYPQEGTARYDAPTLTWHMTYKSVGLDGTTSFGRYRITVIDNDTLDWDVTEWADPLRLIKKMEMTGTYKREK